MKRFKDIEELRSEKRALERRHREQRAEMLEAENELTYWQNYVRKMETDLWRFKERARRREIDARHNIY